MPNKGNTILLGTAVSLIAEYGCAADEFQADAGGTKKRVRERIQYTFKANYTWEEREPLIEAWIAGIKPTKSGRIPTHERLRAEPLMTWAATQWTALFRHAAALKRHGIELLPTTASLSATMPSLKAKKFGVQIPRDRAELEKLLIDVHGELARERSAREAERAKNEALVLENADLKKQLEQVKAKLSRLGAGRPRRSRSS